MEIDSKDFSFLIQVFSFLITNTKISISASITYFAIAIIKNIPMKPYSDSLILAGIQAFLSFKSCIVFLYFGYKYGKLLEDEVGLITSEEFNEDTSAINDDEEVV